jgi:hypothetical protein
MEDVAPHGHTVNRVTIRQNRGWRAQTARIGEGGEDHECDDQWQIGRKPSARDAERPNHDLQADELQGDVRHRRDNTGDRYSQRQPAVAKPSADKIGRWQRVLSVNLWGVINGVHAFTQAMIDQKTPCAIINTGSKQGITSRPTIPTSRKTARRHAPSWARPTAVSVYPKKSCRRPSPRCSPFLADRTMFRALGVR